MSISTRKGDSGTTGLLFGERVSKDHPLVNANGQIDELVKALGLAKVFNPNSHAFLTRLQETLSRIMSEIATPDGKQDQFISRGFPSCSAEDLQALDDAVASLENELPQQKHWEWPGDNAAEAFLANAGAVCRTTERTLVSLLNSGAQQVSPLHLQYFNRLSDWLHLQSRAERLRKPTQADL
jgi:cob(I)alamin adenosyltransferase